MLAGRLVGVTQEIMASEKIKYEIDPHNRLVLLGPAGLREVLDGRFKTTNKNQLVYHVKRPVGRDTPQQIRFKGKWGLDAQHRLVLTLDKWYDQIAGNKLTLQTQLLDVRDNEVVFTVTTRNEGGNQTISLLRLGGIWQADDANRLCFQVEENEGALKLKGEWRLNKRHEIEYDFEKMPSGKIKKVIAFKGFWEIGDRHKLRYVLNRVIGSGFDLKAELESVLADRIEYSLGIGANPRKKTITLFGSWKLDRRFGLGFEVTRADRRVERIAFGAKARVTDKDDIELKLRTTDGRDLGAELVLSRSLLDTQTYLRLVKEAAGGGVFIGTGRRF